MITSQKYVSLLANVNPSPKRTVSVPYCCKDRLSNVFIYSSLGSYIHTHHLRNKYMTHHTENTSMYTCKYLKTLYRQLLYRSRASAKVSIQNVRFWKRSQSRCSDYPWSCLDIPLPHLSETTILLHQWIEPSLIFCYRDLPYFESRWTPLDII